ncbi:MAG: iron ABC transporter permease [Actinomycetota bacterium]
MSEAAATPGPSPAEIGDEWAAIEAGSRGRALLVIAALVAGLAGVALAGGAVGAYPIPPSEVIGSVLRWAGLSSSEPADPIAEQVLHEIRFPRVVLGVIVGSTLATAGAALQGMIRNPLAEPGIVGVSSGAALGASLQIVTGVLWFGSLTLAAAAFVGGLVAVAVVYLLARSERGIEVVTLILTGIAVNAFVGALIGLMIFVSDDAELRGITFWTLGSLAQSTWTKVGIVTPFAVAGLAVSLALARRLDLLALGDASAGHLGVAVRRTHVAILLVVAGLTAAAVSVSGQILFVGLVVPHVVRLAVGPSHRLLLPASALLGAIVLVGADLAARTIARPAELPLGVLTALIGAPWFMWLVRRNRAAHGGWG